MSIRPLVLSLGLCACTPQLLPTEQAPPPGFMQLDVDPLVPGTPAEIRLSVAPTGAEAYLFVAADADGITVCPPELAPTCLDTDGPQFVR